MQRARQVVLPDHRSVLSKIQQEMIHCVPGKPQLTDSSSHCRSSQPASKILSSADPVSFRGASTTGQRRRKGSIEDHGCHGPMLRRFLTPFSSLSGHGVCSCNIFAVRYAAKSMPAKTLQDLPLSSKLFAERILRTRPLDWFLTSHSLNIVKPF